MSIIRKILYGVLAILVIFQFFRIDKTNPPVDTTVNFVDVNNAPDNVRVLFQRACYDCHSYETIYPWYTNIAPVSWWIKHHVNEGREEMNFSEWATFSKKRRNHKIKEMGEELEEGNMPLKSYQLIHSKARITQDERELLMAWVKTLSTDKSE